MQCRSCGTVLQPGVVACPACGTPVPAAPSDFTSYESSGDTIPYAPSVETSSVSSSQQSPPHPQPYTYVPPSPSQQFYLGTSPFPDRGIQQFPSAVEQTPSSQQQRGGLSAGMIALLIILALLVVAAGSGLTYYMIALRPAQHQAQATAVAPIILTKTPGNAQHTTSITATNPQDVYTQATSGTPALTDPLSPQNPNGWQAGKTGNCTFTGNALHATASPTSSTAPAVRCETRSTSFDNFAYQVRATIIQGDLIGLIFRDDPHGLGAYVFAIDSVGGYTLVSADSQGKVKFLTAASSSVINTGLNQSNLLTVIARGSTIYLFINQQYLTSVSDSTSSVGWIGVVSGNARGGYVDVAFSGIQVWRL